MKGISKSREKKIIKMLFLAHIVVLIFWVIAQSFNVYASKVAGAIFELLWFPMILCLFLLPLVDLVFWIKDQFKIKSGFLFLFILAVLLLLGVYLTS